MKIHLFLHVNSYLFWALFDGVPLVSTIDWPTGVLGFVFEFPDKHVAAPKGEQARRFDFLYERLRNRSLR